MKFDINALNAFKREDNTAPAGPATVGLFGTCGNDPWRLAFIQAFLERGIGFFNPVVADWDDSFGPAEAEHLAHDGVIVLPITGSTYGVASIAEAGLSSGVLDEGKTLIIFVEELHEDVDGWDKLAKYTEKDEDKNFVHDCDDTTRQLALVLQARRKDANNARKILYAHLNEQDIPGVVLAKSLDEALEAAIAAVEAVPAPAQ